jgi:hypothetical protein
MNRTFLIVFLGALVAQAATPLVSRVIGTRAAA